MKILFFIKPYEGNPREMKAYIKRIKSSDTYLLGPCVQEQSGILFVYIRVVDDNQMYFNVLHAGYFSCLFLSMLTFSRKK